VSDGFASAFCIFEVGCFGIGVGVEGLGSRKEDPASLLTNPPGHLWRDKWTTLSGPLSQ